MLNTIPTTNGNPATATTNTPNNGKITPSDNTITPADNDTTTNGNTAPSNSKITLTSFDLANIKDTIWGMATAFDDVQTLMHLIHHGNLNQRAIQSIARATQSHANAWADIGNGELDTLNAMIMAHNGNVTVRGQA